MDIGSWITWLFNLVVDGFGSLGIIFAFFILVIFMVVQAVIAPIVSEAVLTSAGGIFNSAFPTYGIAVAIFGGVIGSMLGAATAFYIARFGQEKIAHYVESRNIKEIENPNLWQKSLIFLMKFIDDDSEDFAKIIEERGFLIVLVGRLIPFVPFDAVSYGSGFTTIEFKDFMIATTIGSIPRVTFFILLGTSLGDVVKENGTLFLVLTTIVALALYFGYKLVVTMIRRRNVKEELVETERAEGVHEETPSESTISNSSHK